MFTVSRKTLARWESAKLFQNESGDLEIETCLALLHPVSTRPATRTPTEQP
jgi:hypothetical protein